VGPGCQPYLLFDLIENPLRKALIYLKINPEKYLK
jgi:hypothetical protein